jgi:hypothetical protein
MTIHDIGDLPSLPSSGWLSVDLHVELGASPPTATISLIGSVTTGQTVQLMLTPVPGAAASPELDLGPQYFSPTTNATTDCQINFDDVVVSSP